MVAAFIQSRLAAARMAMAEPTPDHERERAQDVESVDGPMPHGPLYLKDGAWTDIAEASQAFGRFGTQHGRSTASPPDNKTDSPSSISDF